MLRRSSLKIFLSMPCVLAGVPGLVSASGFNHENVSMKLANALRAVGGSDCIAEADWLEARARNERSGIHLHLRNMNLDVRAITIIADAIRSLPSDESSLLRSLSFSYNEALGDEGIIKLVSALPNTLVELGLVGCTMGDLAGEALLRWASNAPNLNMLCIEENKMSESVRNQFARLGHSKPGLLLVI